MSALTAASESQLSAWESGLIPAPDQVRPGIWSFPLPLPNNPLRYVLVYGLELPNGIALVDTGWDTDEAWDALVNGLAQAGYRPADVRAALVTHIHPDHYGLAGRIRQESGAWIALHPADAELIPGRYGLDIDRVVERMREFLLDCGVPAEITHELTSASFGIRDFVDAAIPDVLLQDKEPVKIEGWDLLTLHTPGHSPGHVCFLERERSLLLSGDHVLPRISPNISVHVQQKRNPLADYLDALISVRDLDVAEVLPAHEWRFSPLRPRVEEILAHHQARLEETEKVVGEAPGSTCWEVVQRLSWSRNWSEIHGFQRRAAVGETLAHLVYLEGKARLRAASDSPRRWFPAATD